MIVSVHRGTHAVAQLIPEWTALHALDPHANAWSRPSVRVAFHRMFRPGGRPLVIAARNESGALNALLPLSIRRRRVGTVLLHEVRAMSDWHSCYNDAVVRPEQADRVLAAIARRLRRLHWDTLMLTRVADGAWLCDERFVREIPELCQRPGAPASVVELTRTEPLLAGSDDAEYRRTLRRLRERGEVRIDWEAGGVGGIAASREWIQIHGWLKGYQGQTRTFTLGNASGAFPVWLAEQSDAVGAGLLTIRLDGAMLAGCVILRGGGHAYSYRSAWRPDHSRFGLGILLLTEAMRICRALGDSTFDLGPGDEAYKNKWHPRAQPCVTLNAIRSTWCTRLADQWLRLRGIAPARRYGAGLGRDRVAAESVAAGASLRSSALNPGDSCR